MYSLVANFLRNDTIRNKFLSGEQNLFKFLELLVSNLNSMAVLNPSKLTWIKSVESMEAILVNLAFNTTEEARRKVLNEKLNLFESLKKFFSLDFKKEYYTMVVYRAMQVLSKLEFLESFVKDKAFCKSLFTTYMSGEAKNKGITNHMIRLLIKWFEPKNASAIRDAFTAAELDPLVQEIKTILKENDEERFVNTAILVGNVVEVYPELQAKFRDLIGFLLDLVRNKIGNVRKNAGICVAKLSKDKDNLQVIRDLHGIEVLSSVSKFILGQ